MASKTILFLLGLTIIAVAYATAEVEEDEGEGLAYEDFEEYFNSLQMAKRGGKKIGRKLSN